MNVSTWDKLTRATILMILAFVTWGVVLKYTPVIQTNERMRKRVLELDQQIAGEMAQAQDLDARIHALRQDPDSVARLAREKLGYARPGETVIRFESPEGPPVFLDPPR